MPLPRCASPGHSTSPFPASVSLPNQNLLQRQAWHCWVPQCPPCLSSALGTFPAEPDWAPPSLSIFPSPRAEPWQREGAAYAEQMESIKTKGNGPDSIYYPSKGVKHISRHPQPYGEGEPSRATPVGRDRQGQPCLGWGTQPLTGHSACPGLWLVLGTSQSFPALHPTAWAPSACSLGLHQPPTA